jgi:glucoamylase
VPGSAPNAPAAPARRLDIATPLAAVHIRRADGAHSVVDPKALATLMRIEEMFDSEYAINRNRAEGCGPALGRYSGDIYYSGGAYYFSTLGAAEFYFRFAEAVARGACVSISKENRSPLAAMLQEPEEALAGDMVEPERRMRLFNAMIARGDALMATVRHYTPPHGELSEQFSQKDGTQTSAKNLAWSYAAFITAFVSRTAALNLIR